MCVPAVNIITILWTMKILSKILWQTNLDQTDLKFLLYRMQLASRGNLLKEPLTGITEKLFLVFPSTSTNSNFLELIKNVLIFHNRTWDLTFLYHQTGIVRCNVCLTRFALGMDARVLGQFSQQNLNWYTYNIQKNFIMSSIITEDGCRGAHQGTKSSWFSNSKISIFADYRKGNLWKNSEI